MCQKLRKKIDSKSKDTLTSEEDSDGESVIEVKVPKKITCINLERETEDSSSDSSSESSSSESN